MSGYLWVGLGGFAGANVRWFLGRHLNTVGAAFPYGTFLINLTGSLLIGIVLTLILDRAIADPLWRLLIVVGFLGGYTTFSSYSFETIEMMQAGEWGRALLYVLGSNAIGLFACYAGILFARAVS